MTRASTPLAPLHVALWEPEIPPNTGNIARLCAATGVPLHLIGQLGFRLTDRHLKRAGLDYWQFVTYQQHPTLNAFEDWWHNQGGDPSLIVAMSAHSAVPYPRAPSATPICLLFGSESRGLPPEVLARYSDRTFVIPMPTGKVRSLNLATSVGIVLYDTLRRLHDW